MSVTGTDDSGTGAGTSTPITIQFTQDDILGALYYWTTSGKTAIERWDFVGGAGATPYLTPTNTDGKTCVGCHALSPNGDKLIASAGGENDGRLLLWNVTANKGGSAFPLAQKSQFESWNADGTQFVGMYGDDLPGHVGASNLMLFDGATGAMTSTIDLGGLRADHPDWSKATGGPNTIVFTSVDPTAPTTDQRPATGGIGYVTNVAGTWGPPQVLVPAVPGKNRYYPGISPDGALVVYDESTCANGPPAPGQAPDPSCNADVDPTATMFVTRLTGGTPIPLTRANSPGVEDGKATALTNSFPRWAPFVQHLDEMNKIIWLTFSSTRQYGLRSPAPSTAPEEAVASMLIWMVAINPGAEAPIRAMRPFVCPSRTSPRRITSPSGRSTSFRARADTEHRSGAALRCPSAGAHPDWRRSSRSSPSRNCPASLTFVSIPFWDRTPPRARVQAAGRVKDNPGKWKAEPLGSRVETGPFRSGDRSQTLQCGDRCDGPTATAEICSIIRETHSRQEPPNRLPYCALPTPRDHVGRVDCQPHVPVRWPALPAGEFCCDQASRPPRASQPTSRRACRPPSLTMPPKVS